MATWLKPELLLLDEHTAAVDPKSADQVIALTDEIVKRENLTTLMVTHSMHQAANLGDRLIMMHRGTVVQDFRGAEKKRIRGICWRVSRKSGERTNSMRLLPKCSAVFTCRR